jgi:hypothetical protein
VIDQVLLERQFDQIIDLRDPEPRIHVWRRSAAGTSFWDRR